MKLNTLMQLSIIKSAIFNIKYFGIKSMLKPKVLISKNTILKCLKGNVVVKNDKLFCIKIGFGDVRIFDNKYQRTLIDNRGKIIFEGTATISTGSRVSNTGTLTFGNEFNMTANSSIICHKKIVFKEKCLVSWNCNFLDTDFHKIYDSSGMIINEDGEIIIGKNVWICSGVTVLKGTIIPDNSIIAANSTVSKKLVKESSLYVSNEIKKENIHWEY